MLGICPIATDLRGIFANLGGPLGSGICQAYADRHGPGLFEGQGHAKLAWAKPLRACRRTLGDGRCGLDALVVAGVALDCGCGGSAIG